VRVVPADAARPMEDGVAAIVVLPHLHGGSDKVRAQRTGRDLQPQLMEHHGVVVTHLAFLLHTQDLGQVDPSDRHERRAFLFRLHREPGEPGYRRHG